MLKRVQAGPAHKWDPDQEGDRDLGPGKPIVRSPAREQGTDWNQGPIPRKTREAGNREEAAAPAATWVQVQVGAEPDRARHTQSKGGGDLASSLSENTAQSTYRREQSFCDPLKMDQGTFIRVTRLLFPLMTTTLILEKSGV